jgi:excinuclease ABC subunit B
MSFNLHRPYEPTGDQPKAIEKLIAGITNGAPHQVLLGATGTGKTFTMANVIAAAGRPALVMSPNKTLAAQLYQEFKQFFPQNAVHFFVSYYDYYQPEAYIPVTDTYIEKDASINEFIDQLRHAATASTLTRRDFVIVASVSCIYGIGNPQEYQKASLTLTKGMALTREKLLKQLTALQYQRDDENQPRRHGGTFRARGEVVEIVSPDAQATIRVEIEKNKIVRLTDNAVRIFPAKHFVTPQEKLGLALTNIETEMKTRVKELKQMGKELEAARLKERTLRDLAAIRGLGYCPGIENYSRHLDFRESGKPPHTLLDYLPKDTLIFIDESHLSIPQIRGMYAGDRARKQTLVDYGFRLPSAVDNRPLTFAEFNKKIGQTLYVSATPALYEQRKAINHIAEQVIRPTGLLDPTIEIRPTKNQVRDALAEIKKRRAKGERTLVVSLTKRLAEDIADFLKKEGVSACYLHSDVKTLERPEILRKLRAGDYDAVVGINLLREGLDLPEVALICIFDADQEGFLRNETTLIQTIGRASRHPQGHVILYADALTGSMKSAIQETERRRAIQHAHNKKHGITPTPLNKEIGPALFAQHSMSENSRPLSDGFKKAPRSQQALKKELEREMKQAAKALDFERAAALRDQLRAFSSYDSIAGERLAKI